MSTFGPSVLPKVWKLFGIHHNTHCLALPRAAEWSALEADVFMHPTSLFFFFFFYLSLRLAVSLGQLSVTAAPGWYTEMVHIFGDPALDGSWGCGELRARVDGLSTKPKPPSSVQDRLGPGGVSQRSPTRLGQDPTLPPTGQSGWDSSISIRTRTGTDLGQHFTFQIWQVVVSYHHTVASSSCHEASADGPISSVEGKHPQLNPLHLSGSFYWSSVSV